ncbi:hypothetical protein HPB51_010404 [Rhipicephalus microplus]|uniref:Uncharacterized protein n=1 Tax=Rhipicephalus microplus TaxID=6941 RepID=A0A9J6E8E4_RHIMP|nr:hypothetical protein HPB51_010404 [Rhipicephalus microplus]
MACSLRGEQTADAGRDEGLSCPPPDCRFLLPTLPTGEGMEHCAFLHGDPSKRPYRIEDFREPLEEAGVLKAASGIGAFQTSHVWFLKFHTRQAKDTVVGKGGLCVKGGYCAIIHICKQEITLKIHWVPFHIPGESLQKALSEFGEVKDVRLEEWHVPGFEFAETTTRVVRMVLNKADSHENIMDADEAETTAPITEDCSPRRGPSVQPECSQSSLTDPEITEDEAIEDQNATEQQKCGDRRGCDLSKDSEPC